MSRVVELFDHTYVKLLTNSVDQLRKEVNTLKEQMEAERKKNDSMLNLLKLDNNTTRESGMQYLRAQIGDIMSKSKQFFTESGTVTIPDEVKTVIVTACAGGASGNHAIVEADEIVGGAGGGAGASVIFYPIKINKTKMITFVVGKGGILSSQNGEDTVIKYEDKGITLGGGKACKEIRSHSGGDGGTCDIDPLCNGYSGSSGTESLFDKKAGGNEPASGGTGGSSRFSRGGVGGIRAFVVGENNRLIPSLKGLDGDFGAGGGGSSAGISKELVGRGGDGFVYMVFV